MLQCYQLTDMVTTGTEVAPFLVKMARVTVVPEGTRLIPYMVEYNPAGGEEEGGALERGAEIDEGSESGIGIGTAEREEEER